MNNNYSYENFLMFGAIGKAITDSLPEQSQQLEALGILSLYGMTGELIKSGDANINLLVAAMKHYVDDAKNSYKEKIGNRTEIRQNKKEQRDKMIYQMWNADHDLSAKDIAERLGCSESTVGHSNGWCRRKQNVSEYM